MDFGLYEKELNTAIGILKSAIDVASKGQLKLQNSEVETKKDGTVVSICDFACQAIIMDNLTREFPGDYVVGEEEMKNADEEFLKHVKSLLPNGLDPVAACAKSVRTIEDEYHRCWVIDPIDGTYGFVNQGNYAIAMALLIDKHVVCSAVAWPKHNKAETGLDLDGPVIFIASEGHGAYAVDLNGKFIKLVNSGNPKNVYITTKQKVGNIDKLNDYIMQQMGITEKKEMVSMTKGFMIAADAACAYVRVPWGNCEEHVWDIAPFELLVREAGGIATLGNGKPISYKKDANVEGTVIGCIFSNKGKEFHDKLIKEYQIALEKYKWF